MQQDKKSKRHKCLKERCQPTFIHRCHDCVCRKSRGTNEVIFKKISGSKANMQRLIVFL